LDVAASIARVVKCIAKPRFFSMANDVTRDEFTHLEARVSVVEGEVEGEKLVTRHILEQTRRNGDDLAAIKTRLDGLDQKFGALDSKIDRVETRLDNRIGSLERSIPKIVGDVVREVFRERDDKR
jgi:hypothetical protein